MGGVAGVEPQRAELKGAEHLRAERLTLKGVHLSRAKPEEFQMQAEQRAEKRAEKRAEQRHESRVEQLGASQAEFVRRMEEEVGGEEWR